MQYLSSFLFLSFIYFFPFPNNSDEYKVEQLKEEKRKRVMSRSQYSRHEVQHSWVRQVNHSEVKDGEQTLKHVY